MAKVLIIGAGGVGRVVAHKCAQMSSVFEQIHLASRSIEKCQNIAAEIKRKTKREILTTAVDADQVDSVALLIKQSSADLLINVASPYQNLSLMKACCKTQIHYVDTSLDDERDRIKYDYADQFAFHSAFQSAGKTALLSIGFDPGVVNIFCAHAHKHLFDSIDSIDILDCNDGDHGYAFATNFDPETNLREILAEVISFENGAFHKSKALETQRVFDFPGIGKRAAYLMSHEEVLSLARFIPKLRSVRFWMALSEKYLTHLRVLQNIGMTSIVPISFQGKSIVPIEFLKTLLPDPATLGAKTKGKTCIACKLIGVKNGSTKEIVIYNHCDHEACFAELGSQAISYTTGVPAVLAASLILRKKWTKHGVFCPEQLDPDPFMNAIGEMGLPWKIIESKISKSQNAS